MSQNTQKLITHRLRSLRELDDISVKISGPTKGTIRIVHTRHHAPEFEFHWHPDHFVGYFIDGEGKKSQAVVSLYKPMDAIPPMRFSTIFDPNKRPSNASVNLNGQIQPSLFLKRC